MRAEAAVFSSATIEEIAKRTKGAIKIGPFGSQLRKEEMVAEGVKVYGQENLILSDWSVGNRRISNSKYLGLRSCQLVSGDVVLTMMGTIGKCGVFPDDAEIGIMDSHLLRIQPDTKRIERDYLRLVIAAEQVVGRQIDRLSHGSIMAGLSSSIVKRLEVPLPPLPEQRCITEVLDTLDEAIRKTEEVIAKLQQMKQGLLHDLLTRGIDDNGELRDPERHPEQFKDSLLGLNPREWRVLPLGNTADVQSSNVDKKTVPSEMRVCLCNYMDVYSNDTIHDEIDFMLASATASEIAKFGLRKGDVLITKDSETPLDIAVSAVVKDDLCKRVICGYHLAMLRPRTATIAGTFLTLALQLPKVNAHFRVSANGSTRYGLTLGSITSALLPLPLIPEQLRIVTILDSHEKRITAEESQLAKLRTLKHGLMDDLLTGRMRVKVSEEAAA